MTRIAVHWLLEGSTPSWNELKRIIADMLNAAGFRVDHGKPVLLYDVKSRGALAYLSLAREVITRRARTSGAVA